MCRWWKKWDISENNGVALRAPSPDGVTVDRK